jgi:Predicted hydrolases or acyltransferases (alpha/beta hydrolase superfamily)
MAGPADVAKTGRERRAFWVGHRPWYRRPNPTPPDGPDPYGEPDPEWLRIDWRKHLRRVEVGTPGLEPHPGSPIDPTRTTVNYAELGDGPPLVLVHGLGGSWQNWLENIPQLARSHRVIALDLPGFGASPMPGWEISIQTYGALVSAFCEALGTGPVPLVGNSMGGFVSAEVTVSQPQIVRKLALVSAAGISHARMYRAPAETAARMARAAAPFAMRRYDRALRRPRLRRRMIGHIVHRPELMRREMLWELIRYGLDPPGLVAALRGLAGYDFLDRLPDVETPTLIVWGRNDLVVPVSDALEYARLIRGSQLEIFDGCGHLPMAERPVRFNRLLDRFLAGSDTADTD